MARFSSCWRHRSRPASGLCAGEGVAPGLQALQCHATRPNSTNGVCSVQVAGFLQDSMNARWVKLVGNLVTSLCSSHGRQQQSHKQWLRSIQNFQQSLPNELMFLVSARHPSEGHPTESLCVQSVFRLIHSPSTTSLCNCKHRIVDAFTCIFYLYLAVCFSH